jgi:hypothetical protein
VTDDEINAWAREFAAALYVAGERVPLDRVIAAHLATIMKLREAKLTWRSITAILTRGGARRNDGLPISFDQIKADATRLNRRAQAASAEAVRATPNPPPSPKLDRGQGVLQHKRKTRPGAPRPAPAAQPRVQISETASSKAVSSDDVAAAMARIRK